MSRVVTTTILAGLALGFACQTTEQRTVKQKVDSILIESVDVETHGKRSGSTHFHIVDAEYFLDYKYFDTAEIATHNLEEKERQALKILSKDDLRDSSGSKIGTLITVARTGDKPRCLLWTKVNKLTEVCTESDEAVSNFLLRYEM